MKQRIILAGGSGFVGSALSIELVRRDYEVIVLTRSPRQRADGIREIAWDGKNPGQWAPLLDNAFAIVNLTGKNINCRHTPKNLKAITASRVDSVNAIAAAIKQIQTPPQVWVQASATGFYGDTGNHTCDEAAPNGTDSLAKVCQVWESAFENADLPKTRKVILRLGVVLGNEGGALPVLAKLTKCFLGGSAGSGQQFISWIHLQDLVQMFVTAVERKDSNGTYNAVSPAPTTNEIFMKELRAALHRPWSPPAPAFAIELGASLMGTDPSLALVSQRCVPKRFLEAGFAYRFPELPSALKDLCGQ